jgi:fermentation-respiration switch protein FrsA (DUF1100 family)
MGPLLGFDSDITWLARIGRRSATVSASQSTLFREAWFLLDRFANIMRLTADIVIASVMMALVSACSATVDRFVFDPDRSPTAAPNGIEERWITTADGVRLHAWRGSTAEPVASIVLSHGRGGSVAEADVVLRAFVRRGFDVLAYDYRGYGMSEGTPSEEGIYLDAEAAFDAERSRGVPESRIVCYGESLGGVVAIHLAGRRRCAAVAVVSTFTSIRDLAALQFGPLAVFAPDKYDSKALVGRLTVPFFQAHGDHDAVVPLSLGERLFAAAPEPKRFFRVSGAGHDDIVENEAYAEAVVEEISRFTRERFEVLRVTRARAGD